MEYWQSIQVMNIGMISIVVLVVCFLQSRCQQQQPGIIVQGNLNGEHLGQNPISSFFQSFPFGEIPFSESGNQLPPPAQQNQMNIFPQPFSAEKNRIVSFYPNGNQMNIFPQPFSAEKNRIGSFYPNGNQPFPLGQNPIGPFPSGNQPFPLGQNPIGPFPSGNQPVTNDQNSACPTIFRLCPENSNPSLFGIGNPQTSAGQCPSENEAGNLIDNMLQMVTKKQPPPDAVKHRSPQTAQLGDSSQVTFSDYSLRGFRNATRNGPVSVACTGNQVQMQTKVRLSVMDIALDWAVTILTIYAYFAAPVAGAIFLSIEAIQIVLELFGCRDMRPQLQLRNLLIDNMSTPTARMDENSPLLLSNWVTLILSTVASVIFTILSPIIQILLKTLFCLLLPSVFKGK